MSPNSLHSDTLISIWNVSWVQVKEPSSYREEPKKNGRQLVFACLSNMETSWSDKEINSVHCILNKSAQVGSIKSRAFTKPFKTLVRRETGLQGLRDVDLASFGGTQRCSVP